MSGDQEVRVMMENKRNPCSYITRAPVLTVGRQVGGSTRINNSLGSRKIYDSNEPERRLRTLTVMEVLVVVCVAWQISMQSSQHRYWPRTAFSSQYRIELVGTTKLGEASGPGTVRFSAYRL